MARWKKVLAAICGITGLVYLANASWLFGAPGRPTLVSHLGLGQRFDERGLSLYSCKNDRMLPPTHPYLDNTIPALRAAFGFGADSANIDIHPTSDGQFVVFHDWTVDCRTNGHGVTRELPLATLEKLDIGYRLTADHGRTYPFRGRFVAAMPSLTEVLWAFPSRSFTLVIKSNDPAEADMLMAYLRRNQVDLNRISVFGGDRPVARLRRIVPQLRAASQESIKRCLARYLAIGWTGLIPEACRNTIVPVPLNYRMLIWGWPNVLVKRMASVNSDVRLIGPYEVHSANPGMNLVDSPQQLAAVADDYAGKIFVDRVDVIGPAARARGWLR